VGIDHALHVVSKEDVAITDCLGACPGRCIMLHILYQDGSFTQASTSGIDWMASIMVLLSSPTM